MINTAMVCVAIFVTLVITHYAGGVYKAGKIYEQCSLSEGKPVQLGHGEDILCSPTNLTANPK